MHSSVLIALLILTVLFALAWHEITPYLIELHFNQWVDESDRRFFNSVPTSLQLPAKTVDRLRQLAARELAGNEEFKKLVHDLRNNQDHRVRLTSDIAPSQGN
jgi:hypothetical protein